MSQNYSELRKDNVRDAIYEDVANNLEVLRTSWSGNAFPENPKVGQPCYRVDEDNLYYWDGIEWSQKGGGGAAKMKVMELPASGTERYSVELEGGRCLDKNVMFVFVDKVAQEPSTYDLNSDGTVVNFTPAIPANATLTLRWFSSDVGTTDTSIIATDEEVSAGVAIDKVPNVSQLATSIGKVPVGVKTYSSSLVYSSGEVVISSGENVTMYKSLVDGNTGHALTETEYWEEISLGGDKADIDASNFNADGKSLLSGLGMPSNRYIDLTLGASGQTYKAPANGWFVLRKAANNVGQYVYMYTTGVDIGTCFNVASGTDIPSYFLPVKDGDIVRIDYTLGGATMQFRFIYAEGEN